MECLSQQSAIRFKSIEVRNKATVSQFLRLKMPHSKVNQYGCIGILGNHGNV